MTNIHESWKPLFEQYEFDLEELYNTGDTVYPPKECIFKVFEMDVKEIRVLLLGQDPYHNEKQAHGLSFSVPEGIRIPPSLKNIYKELQFEFPERKYEFCSGNLERWFYEEKIFLLNAALSVIKNKPSSQISIWEDFTNDVIKFVSVNNKKCVFLLLGNFAKSKEKFIKNKERIVECVHPSPFSANNGFFHSGVFKKVESRLGQPVNWSIL
uniref:Uracil-DNA glycosylase-like domain-containing protein n=1 Tax=viral metagenome TaxID=1070528 RepID=A0A6C0HDW3_9ZZZZ